MVHYTKTNNLPMYWLDHCRHFGLNEEVLQLFATNKFVTYLSANNFKNLSHHLKFQLSLHFFRKYEVENYLALLCKQNTLTILTMLTIAFLLNLDSSVEIIVCKNCSQC